MPILIVPFSKKRKKRKTIRGKVKTDNENDIYNL